MRVQHQLRVEGAGLPTSGLARRRAAPALRPFVASYTGYREVDTAPALHRGLPSPWITLILTLDEPLTMLDRPGGNRRDFDALIGGLHTTPAFIHHEGRQSGIQVSLKPLGARALLGMPAGELTAVDLPAVDVFGRWVDLLRDQLRTAVTWQQRFDLVDGALLARIGGARRTGRPAPEVVHAWELLIASQGRASVDAVPGRDGSVTEIVGPGRAVRPCPAAPGRPAVKGRTVTGRPRGPVRFRGPVAPDPGFPRARGSESSRVAPCGEPFCSRPRPRRGAGSPA